VRADGRGAETRRVQEVDAVASMLPKARCGRLAELLTEDDATLRPVATRHGRRLGRKLCPHAIMGTSSPRCAR
jgi:hypothetical protein